MDVKTEEEKSNNEAEGNNNKGKEKSKNKKVDDEREGSMQLLADKDDTKELLKKGIDN